MLDEVADDRHDRARAAEDDPGVRTAGLLPEEPLRESSQTCAAKGDARCLFEIGDEKALTAKLPRE